MASHIIVSTKIRLESGPTIVGDEQSDRQLMTSIGGKLVKEIGNESCHWQVDDPPRVVLDRLDALGYRIISSCGVGQTCIWTLRRDNGPPSSTPVK